MARGNAAPTNHQELISWVGEIADLTQPDEIVWCDGSEAEYHRLAGELVAAGHLHQARPDAAAQLLLRRLRPLRRGAGRGPDLHLLRARGRTPGRPTTGRPPPRCGRSSAARAARAACSAARCAAGRCTSSRSAWARSARRCPRWAWRSPTPPYVAVSMRTMTRMGQAVLDELGTDGAFVKAVHTVGAPLAEGEADVPWPCNATKYISHFPEDREIWSYGSGYGGNALLGKKCYALRIASVMARDEGWLAEHMLILKLTPAAAARPQVRRRRLPVRLRQDQPGDAGAHHLRLDRRDHRRRHRLDALRRGRPAVRDQPGGRLLRRRPRHRRAHQRQRHEDDVRQLGLHQRRAHRRRRRVVGGHDRGAARPTSPTGRATTGRPRPAPRPPTPTPASPCPPRSARSSRPSGRTPRACRSRRSSSAAAAPRAVPLVTESFDWQHGVFLGANVASEKTAAAEGKVGELRRDPFAMLPFCGYNMGDYFGHWVSLGQDATTPAKLPKIYYVNWFRKDAGRALRVARASARTAGC